MPVDEGVGRSDAAPASARGRSDAGNADAGGGSGARHADARGGSDAGNADAGGGSGAGNADAGGGGGGEDARWLVIGGRRWRRTDPALPVELVEALKSHLGRGRSGVRVAKKAGDEESVAAARRRVGLAKLGLGERGAYWWTVPEADRVAQARESLEALGGLDATEPPAAGEGGS